MQIIYRKLSTKKTVEHEVLKMAVGDIIGPIKIGKKDGEMLNASSIRVALHTIQKENDTVYRTKERADGLIIERAF